VDGARCALIMCAVCPGDFVLFETLKDVQSDRTMCFGSLKHHCISARKACTLFLVRSLPPPQRPCCL
jgi:hypothetical protein